MTTDKKKATTLCHGHPCDFVVLGGEFQEQVCSKCQCRVLEPEGAQRLCQTYLSVPPPLFHEVIKHGMPTDVNCILCRTRMVASELKGQWLHLCPGCGALLCEAGELLNVTRGHLKDTPFTELPTPILKQERNQVILYESSILPHTLVPYDPKTEPETSEIMARVARALPMTTTIVQGTYKETLKELVIYSLVVTLTTVTLGSLAAGITLSVLYGSLRRPKLFMNHITKRFALTRMPIPWRWWPFHKIKNIRYSDTRQSNVFFEMMKESIAFQLHITEPTNHAATEGATIVTVWFHHQNGRRYALPINETDSFQFKKYLGVLYQLSSSLDGPV